MANNKKILTYRQTTPGQIKCTINLSQLFLTNQEFDSFTRKWPLFLDSDPYNQKIYKLNQNKLIYKSEQLVPTKTDSKPPILLVFGNPATLSVVNGMFFSSKEDGKEGRFWKSIMRASGILDLPFDPHLSYKKLNSQRKRHLLKLDYDSPFRIGLCVFISMPSAPSKDYSGVAGIQKLVGAKAMRRLEVAERKRVLECARKFLSPDGAIVAFQKNAWNGLCSENDPKYGIKLARAGELKGTLIGNSKIPLFCVPPTRLAGPCRSILKKVLKDRQKI